jgi:proteic killer suppression protein
MIKSFRDRRTEDLFNEGRGDRKWQSFRKVARRKLVMVHSAAKLSDLRAPPNNQLEALVDDRDGQHSIRINDQYRVCFKWDDGHAYQVEIVDFH